jgi:hypothetical protein
MDLRQVCAKKGTVFRFLSTRTLGLKFIPACGANGGWRGFVHANCGAWADVLLFCAGRAHWAPPTKIWEWVRL